MVKANEGGIAVTSFQNKIEGSLKQAIDHHKNGRLHEAKDLYRKIIISQPENADAHNLFGCLAFQAGFHQEAVNLITKAITINSNQPVYYINLGSALVQNHEYHKAIKAFKRAKELQPNNIHIYINLGNALLLNEDPKAAISCYKEALDISPGSEQIQLSLANTLSKINKIEEAIEAYKSVLEINSENETALQILGENLAFSGQNKKAIFYFDKLLKINSDNAKALESLGGILLQEGQLEEAEATFKKAIKIDPELAIVYTRLSKLKTYKKDNKEVNDIERLYEKSKPNSKNRMFLCFALGKVYEDIQDYEKSFHYLAEGNDIKRSTFEYNIQIEDVSRLQATQGIFNQNVFARMASAGYEDKTPIFIVGMPRSGTTLIEQILASHPDVYGAGELTNLKQIARKIIPESGDELFPAYRRLPTNKQCWQIGKAYVDDIRQYSSTATHITNKLPGNFSLAGLIKLSLPQAKIIHCKRDPMDTCFSIFKNYFYSAKSYFYNLEEIGTFYCYYQKTMAHWLKTLPYRSLYEVQYEDLIADQQHEIGGLLDFCELKWHDNCLEFYKTKRTVKTISVTQVRKPIYQDSLQKWKHYENWLKPLIDNLDLLK